MAGGAITGGHVSLPVSVANGGTASTTIAGARTSLLISDNHPGIRSSALYTHPLYAASSTLAVSANFLYLVPVIVPANGSSKNTATKIGIEVTTTATSGKSARMGIFNCTAGVPGTLVVDAGTVSIDAAAVKELTISQQLQPGYYFLGVVFEAAVTIRAGTISARNSIFGLTNTTSTSITEYVPAFAYGALTNNPTATEANSTTVPLIYLKF